MVPGRDLLSENVPDAVRALQTERDVRPALAHRIGVPDDHDFGDRQRLDGFQDFRNERGGFGGQRVGLEPELQDEVTWGRRQGVQRAAEDPLDLRLAHRDERAGTGVPGDTGRGARSRDVHDAKRTGDPDPPGRSSLRIRQQHDQRRRHRACRFRRLGDTPGRTSGQQDHGDRRDKRRWSLGHWSTRIATVVPRTPTMADGVSRRMESGASFAMRPDTYAATPRANFSTIAKPPSPGLYM